MEIPPVPTPPVPAPSLPRLPVVGTAGGASQTFAMRLAEIAGAAPVGAVPASGQSAVGAPAGDTASLSGGAALRAASAARTRGVTLGAMLAARSGLATPAVAGSAAVGAQVAAAGVPGEGPFAGHAAVVAPTSGRVSSSFGMRTHPITGQYRHHDGLDLAAASGMPVVSVTDGTVVAAGDRGGYGLTVDVDHGNGTMTRYAHLSAIDVEVGQAVGAGVQLGDVGSTGRSTGPHLHVEVRVDGAPVDPAGLW